MKIGDRVQFWKLPDWHIQMPEESRRVFKECFGHNFRISGIDKDGLFILDVSQKVDTKFGGFMNEIHLEAEFLRRKPAVRQKRRL